MKREVLLCADLDRTLLPNGPQPESHGARWLLQSLVARPEVTLVYVSGRHRALQRQAIEAYQLPLPDYAIGAGGTRLYDIVEGRWQPWENWTAKIAAGWQRQARRDVPDLLADIELLRPQEAEQQNDFKLSYYAPTDIAPDKLLDQVRRRLQAANIRASLIWSIDEMLDVGMLDILPERATKRHAIEFLMQHRGFTARQTVFAGDSGNDLPALTSGLQAVLVKNARDAVREAALNDVRAAGRCDCLYLARGGLFAMNGNYAAGVLEGVVHFLPHTLDWLRQAA
jgi:hypothetical protein